VVEKVNGLGKGKAVSAIQVPLKLQIRILSGSGLVSGKYF